MHAIIPLTLHLQREHECVELIRCVRYGLRLKLILECACICVYGDETETMTQHLVLNDRCVLEE